MTTDYSHLRQHMVDEQIISRGIKDPATIASMLEVPRHTFVPPEIISHAYDDSPLPIGQGQTISQPYIVALMTQAAQLNKDASVLEIGTGSGYAAAILSKIVDKVYTIERLPYLAEEAIKRFQQMNYSNIRVKIGDGTLGWQEFGPYDAIIVTAAAPVLPQALLGQLKPTGKLIIPVGDALSQQLWRISKDGKGGIVRELVEFVRFVPLIGEQGWRE